MNRANARLEINFEEKDYLLFLKTLKEAQQIFEIDILAFCIMINHFHLIIYTKFDGEMGRFMKWLTLTYTQRWHKKHQTIGYGHLFQGRYKSVLIAGDMHLETAIRYVERNPLTANLVSDLLDWRYSSLYQTYRLEDEKYQIELEGKHFKRTKEYLVDLIKPLTNKELEKLKKLE
jgi:putative transposase